MSAGVIFSIICIFLASDVGHRMARDACVEAAQQSTIKAVELVEGKELSKGDKISVENKHGDVYILKVVEKVNKEGVRKK